MKTLIAGGPVLHSRRLPPKEPNKNGKAFRRLQILNTCDSRARWDDDVLGKRVFSEVGHSVKS